MKNLNMISNMSDFQSKSKKIFSRCFGGKISLFTKLLFALFLLGILSTELSVAAGQVNVKQAKSSKIWVGTWSTSPMLVEPNNMPPAPGLTNNTLRQVVHVSIGGNVVRLRFSNVFSKSPVTMKKVAIAVSKEGGTVDASTQKMLTFKKMNEVTMSPNAEVTSDPLSFNLAAGSRLAITIYFGNTSPDVTGHPGSRTTSYILEGDKVSAADFDNAVKTDHWYVINGIDVKASSKAATIAVLGNSITDGRGSGTNKQNRWTDILSEQLLKNPATRQYGVLNLGIGGNCVVRGGLGPTALARFDRDILSQSSVRWLIILEGINDIGGIRSSEDVPFMVKCLIDAYSSMIDKAHAKGIKVYGATILPFAKSFYDKDFRQLARDQVNEWIRKSGRFDAVIDFDKIMQNPDAPATILSDMHDGDFLHPNQAGYKRMGESIDLNLFK
jgi:lysophospholipase L1-like esterase